MELFRTNEFYIFLNGEHSLWWDRETGAFIPKTGWDLTDADDPVCLGLCDGLVGKVEHNLVFDPRLLIIRESLPVGKIHGGKEVYRIKSVAFLPLGPENVEINLQPCPKHKSLTTTKSSTSTLFEIHKNPAFTKTWGTLKNAGNTIKNTTQHAAAIATGTPKRRDFKDKERFEKQIIEEFYKIFTDTNSFYFSRSTDLTNSLERLCILEKEKRIDENALWKTVDDRFFWNKHMMKDLIELQNPLCDPWILPIIQGFIQIEDCKVDVTQDVPQAPNSQPYEIFTLAILSRRSRFRAGTRYKRRGVDEEGHCANYVETEQLVIYHSHEVSFVQVRGSVPVYWSQPGYKYRPPPRLDKGEAETKIAFAKHFKEEIDTYGPVCIINLIDQSGKEKVIFDAYSHHVLQYNSPDLTYVTFDFHEYCRGMHFENVNILLTAIAEIIKDMKYSWRDKQGHICSQSGVFRVNCIDCLDRTNVVQTALGKAVMEIQFSKLGLISPEGSMPNSIKSTFQLLWANNGDIISKQYAGTNALKGDYTRTGERKFTGIMKDGMNSANRYLINHFNDSIRQCCLDLMHGETLQQIELDDFWFYVRTLSAIASECLPAEAPLPYTPHFTLQQEFELANAIYQMSRYYLSRFKDTSRQGTIDLMLGNYVSEDVFNENKAAQYEEDSVATAEHVKLLIEDCKKMLINEPENTLGAWGLINTDPSTGDPNETEMDTILILTKTSYFVADYDDQVDKITKYQEVLLKDLVMLEFGIPVTSTTLFKSPKNKYCIRLNYKVNNVCGYYHMFRSTNLRFFNNMAVVIKNPEEEIESLRSICEAVIVALDIAGLPEIPYVQGGALDRRKSKVVSGSNKGSIYLDIVNFPQMTRNVSESQLLALKTVGSKALSNVTQQFSKLNKIGTSLRPKNKKPNFTIGFNKSGTSSESEDDYPPGQIPEDNGIPLPYSTGVGISPVEQGVEVTETTVLDKVQPLPDTGLTETFLPSVGIVMGSKTDTTAAQGKLEERHNLLKREDSSQVDEVQLSSIMDSVSIQSNLPPEIQINSEGGEARQQPPTTLKLDKKFSRSSGEVHDTSSEADEYYEHDLSSNADYVVTANITQSQSESALKNKLASLTSPVTSATKDLVLSPFSKLAKGVQNLGANLDPRKLSGQVRHISEKEMEEHRQLQERWQNSKTRLIAL